MALLKAPKSGVPMGELSDALRIPASILKHDLIELERAAIVSRTQEGRKSLLTADTVKLNEVVDLVRGICRPPADTPD